LGIQRSYILTVRIGENMTNAELGKYLARKLFDVGSFDTDACQRIQFKGGRKTPADPETSLGGFGEKTIGSLVCQDAR